MKPLRVLIVEDEILIAETIKLYLEERGHSVTDIAISYEEALDSYLNNRPDIILLDIRLYGKLSGLDFARFLSEEKVPTPYVFLTSQLDSSTLNNAFLTNPKGYLSKPIHKQSLWTTVALAYQQSTAPNLLEAITIRVQDGNVTHNLLENEICFIQAEHVYIRIEMEDKRVIFSRLSLSQISKYLQSACFIQIHRSYIININYVIKYTAAEVFIHEHTLPISRSRKNAVLEKLNLK